MAPTSISHQLNSPYGQLPRTNGGGIGGVEITSEELLEIRSATNNLTKEMRSMRKFVEDL